MQRKSKVKCGKLVDKFKQQCIQLSQNDAPAYIINAIKYKSLEIDLALAQAEDAPFLQLLTQLPVSKIHLFFQDNQLASQRSNMNFFPTCFKNLIFEIGKRVESLETLKSLILLRVPIDQSHLQILKDSIAKSQCLKQLSLRQCALKDQHIEILQTSIAKNQSLVILDLSCNKLNDVGKCLGKVIWQQSTRRDQMVWHASLRGESLGDDLSKKGLCEINLQGNQLSDKSAMGLIQFLKDDQWIRCLNLKNNKLGVEGIKQFAKLMKKNSSLISLDLRGNPGLFKEYSTYILKKLKQNIEKYKQQKENYSKKQPILLLGDTQNNQHKSLQQSRKQVQKKKNERAVLEFTLNKNNMTSIHQSGVNFRQSDEGCKKCRDQTLQNLKLEKRNLDLQIQIKRLKYILLTKNTDLSVILPQHSIANIASQANESFNKAIQFSINVSPTENDEDLIAKVQQIMLQLTKIMDNIDTHQNTQINISNNISNVNSLSNTIPLFTNASQMEELEESSIQVKDLSSLGKPDSQKILP